MDIIKSIFAKHSCRKQVNYAYTKLNSVLLLYPGQLWIPLGFS